MPRLKKPWLERGLMTRITRVGTPQASLGKESVFSDLNHLEVVTTTSENFCGDVATSCSNTCDVIFISKDLAERIKDRARVPLVIINNFMDKKEVEDKFLVYYETVK